MSDRQAVNADKHKLINDQKIYKRSLNIKTVDEQRLFSVSKRNYEEN
jgi:hypothetical protein